MNPKETVNEPKRNHEWNPKETSDETLKDILKKP